MFHRFEIKVRNVLNLLRGLLLKAYLLTHGCTVGKRLKCKSWPIFRTPPQSNMVFGNNVGVGWGVTFDPVLSGKIILGDNVNLSQNLVISSFSRVEIGEYTQIGEFVSIRDANHRMDVSELIVFQGHDSKEIFIGNDVWIGAGSRVLKGAKIPNGVVIGANSLVTEKNVLDEYCVYSGTPAKLIRKRPNA